MTAYEHAAAVVAPANPRTLAEFHAWVMPRIAHPEYTWVQLVEDYDPRHGSTWSVVLHARPKDRRRSLASVRDGYAIGSGDSPEAAIVDAVENAERAIADHEV
jgi:hypothetical protein